MHLRDDRYYYVCMYREQYLYNIMYRYNNQWMIIDYNMFKKGETKLQDGLLWVLEQLP